MDTKILMDALKGWRHFADSFKAAKYQDGHTPKARYSNIHGATRPGAVHHIGGHFYPRQVTELKLNTGKLIRPTPALYRRLHLGDAKKVKALNGS